MPRILCANDHVKADDGLPCERCEQIEGELMTEACGCEVDGYPGIDRFKPQILYCEMHDPQTVAALVGALGFPYMSPHGNDTSGEPLANRWVLVHLQDIDKCHEALRRVEGRA